MAYRRFGDRVKETSPTNGTGTLELAGAPVGFRAFADVFDSGQAEIPYLCVDNVTTPTAWEVGYGTFTNASPDTFARNTVHASSAGGTTKVSWAAGCTIINTPTSEWFVTLFDMMKVAQKTGAYTVALGDRARTVEATSGTWTLTLPAVATAGNGFWFAFRNTGSGVVTLDGNSSETINGATTLAVSQGGSFMVVCTGTAWVTIGSTFLVNDLTQVVPAPTDMVAIADASDSNNNKKVSVLALAGRTPVAKLSYTQGSGANGGGTTGTAWTKYPLSEEADGDGIVTVASQVFTLGAGTYHIWGAASFWSINNVRSYLRVRNTSDSTTAILGVVAGSSDAGQDSSTVVIDGYTTIAGSKNFELQYYVAAAQATTGLGSAISSGENEEYGFLMIEKIAD